MASYFRGLLKYGDNFKVRLCGLCFYIKLRQIDLPFPLASTQMILHLSPKFQPVKPCSLALWSIAEQTNNHQLSLYRCQGTQNDAGLRGLALQEIDYYALMGYLGFRQSQNGLVKILHLLININPDSR